jgi:NADH-quinone oxidoreductase subunit H
MRFGLFFLAEYMNVFAVSCVAALLFLGGGALPFTDFPKSILTDTLPSMLIVNAITIGVFGAKVAMFIFVMFWIRATLPRMRVDQLMGFAWKYLVPLSILNIPIAAVWYEMVLRHPTHRYAWIFDLDWCLGVLVTGALEVVAIGAVHAINRAAAAGPAEGVDGYAAPRAAGLAGR